jgi:hypothetical protein
LVETALVPAPDANASVVGATLARKRPDQRKFTGIAQRPLMHCEPAVQQSAAAVQRSYSFEHGGFTFVQASCPAGFGARGEAVSDDGARDRLGAGARGAARSGFVSSSERFPSQERYDDRGGSRRARAVR